MNAKKDFFVSYNEADKAWAEWIAWTIEDCGYTTILQAWDFRPGQNFVIQMHAAASSAERTIAVLSTRYLAACFTNSEWAAAFAKDPTGARGTLIPIRVDACVVGGLIGSLVIIDIHGLCEYAAKEALSSGIRDFRAKPSQPPQFPGNTIPASIRIPPAFPGVKPSPEHVGADVQLSSVEASMTGHALELPSTVIIPHSAVVGSGMRLKLKLRQSLNLVDVIHRGSKSLIGKYQSGSRQFALKRTEVDLCHGESVRKLVVNRVQSYRSKLNFFVLMPIASWSDSQYLWELQPFIVGRSVLSIIERSGFSFNGPLLRVFCDGLADCISGIHSLGMAHCDISPHNIYITSDYDVVIMDNTLCASGKFKRIPFGRRGFSAPEQASGTISTVNDWYSLGATLFYLATRRIHTDYNKSAISDVLSGINFGEGVSTKFLSDRGEWLLGTGGGDLIAYLLRMNSMCSAGARRRTDFATDEHTVAPEYRCIGVFCICGSKYIVMDENDIYPVDLEDMRKAHREFEAFEIPGSGTGVDAEVDLSDEERVVRQGRIRRWMLREKAVLADAFRFVSADLGKADES